MIIPYSEGGVVNSIHENQKVISEEYVAEGTLIELLCDEAMYEKLREYRQD